MRLPPFGVIDSRDGTLTKSPFLRNGYIVKEGDSAKVEKRPGLRLFDALGAAVGRALLSFIDPATGDEALFPITGTSIYQSVYGVETSLTNQTALGTTFPTRSSFWIAGDDGSENSDKRISCTGLVNHGGYLWAVMGRNSWADTTGQTTGSDKQERQFAYYSSNSGKDFVATFDVAAGDASYPSTRQCCVLSYNNKLWVLGGETDPSTYHRDVWSSPDGVTWTEVVDPVSNWTSGRTVLRACVHNNKMYVIVGTFAQASASQYDGVFYSTDGITWTATANHPWTTTTPQSNSSLGFMFSVGGNLIVTQVPRTSGDHQFAYSTDNGENWTLGSHTSWPDSASTETGNINAWKSGGTVWIVNIQAVPGSDWSIKISYTTDGTSYTDFTTVTGLSTNALSPWINKARTSGTFYEPTNPAMMTADGPVWITANYAYWSHDGRYDAPVCLLALASTAQTVTIGTVQGAKFDAQQEYDLSTMAIKSTTAAYQLDTVNYTLSQVTDTDYPTQTVRGLVYLNGIFYVMDPDGTIYGSDEDDFTAWDPTNFVSAEFEPDGGRGIAKLDNYLVAFGIYTTEFFWDAGNATGSTLSPVQSAPLLVGCVNGDSIQEVEGSLVWIAQSKGTGQTYTGGKFVANLRGTNVTRLSSPSIDKLLEADGCTDVDSLVLSRSGQTFLILNLNTSNVSLVYHFQSKMWYPWTQQTIGSDVSVSSITRVREIATVTTGSAHGYSTGDLVEISGASQSGYNGVFPVTVTSTTVFTIQVNPNTTTPATGTIVVQKPTEGQFTPAFACTFDGMQLCLGANDGNVYEFDPDTYRDNSEFIDFRPRTDKYDGRSKDEGGSNEYKECSALEVIGDKTASGNLFVRWTDDDFQNWSNWRWLDPTADRTRTDRLGIFRRRSYELLFTENLGYRMETIEMEVNK